MDSLSRLAEDLEQYRHESFMRDDRLDKRMDRLVTMQEEQWRTMHIVVGGIEDLGNKVVEVVTAINALTVRVDKLTARMEQTDQRWNQLIDIIAKQHKNGDA